MFGFLIVPIKHKHADIRNYISLESAKQNWKKALDFEARCNHGSDPSFYPETILSNKTFLGGSHGSIN